MHPPACLGPRLWSTAPPGWRPSAPALGTQSKAPTHGGAERRRRPGAARALAKAGPPRLAKDVPRGRLKLAPQTQGVTRGEDRPPTPRGPDSPRGCGAGRGWAELREGRDQDCRWPRPGRGQRRLPRLPDYVTTQGAELGEQTALWDYVRKRKREPGIPRQRAGQREELQSELGGAPREGGRRGDGPGLGARR